ncbi:hypothetical protein CLTEP_26280 [Clostridium tepidiprofundi DSM 19306]|uniref:YbbD head domain-containing protein n=1 Tax=Clostridium tepidiprofundi DSM 19306 TaxID=1121338 RepID=A0A151AS52_9CLOT|nr:hypothetical protein [Clostridium tepidiprofundi]KYH30481.1 hypothetical protein CLTEP_26280 [Clostridium tepidiprofundi DSM 19306]
MNTLVLSIIFFILYIITKLLLSSSVYLDSKSIQLNPKFWSIIIILLPNYIGFVFYLIIRTITLNKTFDKGEKNMNIFKKKKSIIVILAISILTLGTSYYCLGKYFDDIKSSKYSTYEDAISMIKHGWIPYNMPKTATEIYEIHNIDTNIGNGMFKLSKKDSKDFYAKLVPINKTEILNLKSIKSKWWNEQKIKNNVKNNLLLAGKDNDFIYAIDLDGTVYFWINH